jgi:hypothetical protein
VRVLNNSILEYAVVGNERRTALRVEEDVALSATEKSGRKMRR